MRPSFQLPTLPILTSCHRRPLP